MTAPTWVAYEMTHQTGTGVLPASEIPAYLREAHGAGHRDGRPGQIVETTPTTRLAQWMCRRGNRSWGLPLAVVAAVGYATATLYLYGMHHMAVWVFVALFAWNAAKFTLVAAWLLVAAVVDLCRSAVRRVSGRQGPNAAAA